MKTWPTTEKSRTIKIGVVGIGLAIGFGLIVHLEASVAQQPAAGQSQPGAAATRADGMPANFPYKEPDPISFDDHAGYVQIFDGVSLNGWDGDPA